jgi:hypothetical protein
MKIGFSHLSRWERFAIVTDAEWIRLTIRAFAFLLSGPVKFFRVGEEQQAQAWITGQ